MADILFIKTSSLGDVIHHMPALSEAHRHRPKARFVWVVEEAYAPLVRLHPVVGEVLPVAWRRWPRQIYSPRAWQQIAAADLTLRSRRYDEVVDTQGLLKSALIASRARGRKHGYDSASIKEKAASAFYDVRHKVSRDLHAIERNRILTALSLGYQPQGAPQYGLDRERLRTGGERYAVLLHGTARPEKEWPLAAWTELGRLLKRRDLDLVLPWGNDAELMRAGQIVAALPRARVADQMPIDGVARLIAGAEFVVGVDTGLLHLAAALGVPLVAIFGGSEPRLTGPVGAGPIDVVGAKGAMPSAVEVVAALSRITT